MERMNIQQTINELLASGMTQSEIASEIGKTQAYVSFLANGKNGASPSYDLVVRLQALRLRKFQPSTKNKQQG